MIHVQEPINRDADLLSPHYTVALIPAYNEERFIGSVVLTALSYVDLVLVVDDGSYDHTAEVARKAGATVLRHETNIGKSAAVNTGFTYLRALGPTTVVMLDGDGQHSADEIPVVLEPVLNGRADVVIGSRYLGIKSDIPDYRKVGQYGLTLITNFASGVHITDSQSGFRAFSPQALNNLLFSQGGFSVESEMQFLVNEHKLRLAEVPINVTYAEPAKRNPVRHGMQVVNGILRLVGQIRPLLFFGVSGLMLILLGTLLGLHIIDVYAHTKTLAIGYSLITVLLCVVGVLLSFVGVILHSLRGMLIELRKSLIGRLESGRRQARDEGVVIPLNAQSLELAS
ncbi:MAG: glycosyltransferase family 2 protein [Herpetosiphon sp.]